MEDIETTLHNSSLSEKYLELSDRYKFKSAIDDYKDSLKSIMKNTDDEDSLNKEFIIDSLSSIRGFLSIIDNNIKDTLYGKGIKMTTQEKCAWKETSENNRFKLSLSNGDVEIYHFQPTQFDLMNVEYYEVSLFDKAHVRYATYKDSNLQGGRFVIFKSLYQSVRELLEKIRRRKMALLYNELSDFDGENSNKK